MFEPNKFKVVTGTVSSFEATIQSILEKDVDAEILNSCAHALRRLTMIVGARNTVAGWRTNLDTGLPNPPRDPSVLLMLITTEISEAFEGWRRGDIKDDKLTHRTMMETELADAIYRILDMAEEHKLDIGGAFAEKMAFNMCREDHKKKSRLAEGGKKL